MTDKTAACLKTSDGCCSTLESFRMPLNPCFLLGKIIKSSSPQIENTKVDNLFSDAALPSTIDSGSFSKLIWINVTFIQFFSISSYESLVGIGGSGSFELIMRNTTLEKIYLPKNPISITAKKEIIKGNIALNTTNVIDYNPYFIENSEGFQYSFLVFIKIFIK